uniref:Uncharacterized protein n=1 Tax=Oryza nivara TaxID=4536 RepID=A0A0E0G5S3_ORYNI
MTKAVASAKTNGAGELRKCRSRRRERIGAEVAGDGDDDEGSGERKDQRHDGVEAGLQIWSFWVGWRERSRSRSFRAIPAEEVGMHVLLSAHPCPSNIMWLKKLGVYDVVTLSESYERLAHGIENLETLRMESKFFKFLGFMWNPLS